MDPTTRPRRIPTARARIAAVLLGLCLALLLLEIGLRVAGLAFLYLQERRNRASLGEKGDFRIMCLGESTTALGGENSYPRQLEELLNKAGTGRKISVINKGVPSVQTSYILEHLEANVRSCAPHMVAAMMGINDSSDLQPYDDIFVGGSKPRIANLRVYKCARLLWDNVRIKTERLTAGDDAACIEKGRVLAGQNRLRHAERMFALASERNPANADAWFELGSLRLRMGKWSPARKDLEQATALAPDNDDALVALGFHYRNTGLHEEAQRAFKTVLARTPGSYPALIGLGTDYTWTRRYSDAERIFREAIDVDPSNPNGYRKLGDCYQRSGRMAEALEAFRKARELAPDDPGIAQLVEMLSPGEGGTAASRPSGDEAAGFDGPEHGEYPPGTRANFLALKQSLDKRGIPLVCVQYPMRSVARLREIFGNDDSIIFVDNEISFRSAVAREGYLAYFTDSFAGDFGHCTPKGNRLIAENIGNTLLKDYFRTRRGGL